MICFVHDLGFFFLIFFKDSSVVTVVGREEGTSGINGDGKKYQNKIEGQKDLLLLRSKHYSTEFARLWNCLSFGWKKHTQQLEKTLPQILFALSL